MELLDKGKELLGSVRTHWKTPAESRYCTYKEILSMSFGGIGVKFIKYCADQMLISTTNIILANTIGIAPIPLYIIYVISLIAQFPLTAIRANMIDNSRNKKGKYRPYLISMGIPSVILSVAFIWMPYQYMNMTMKCIVVLLFDIGLHFFYTFYTDAYDSLVNVMSPNSIERSDIYSVRNVVDNFAPSIVGIFLPLFAKAITGEDTLTDIRIYRYIFPVIIIVGFFISLLVYVNTEEKIVRSKNHFVSIRFSDALRAVIKNKYFWVISLAGWLGFLESAYASILAWMYTYQHACTAGEYTLIVAVIGNASFWPNLIGPVLIRKYGKKRILVYTNLLNIGVIAAMYPIVQNTAKPHIIWVLVACMFVNGFISALGHLLIPAVNSDIRDYQQYISGERIDGMFASVGLIGNIITVGTGLVLPLIYDRAGLNAEVAIKLGYSADNVYDVLNDPTYFTKICCVLIIASTIGAILNVIPFFFYDMTETKQKSQVEVLKLRAAIEDAEGDEIPDDVKEIVYTVSDNSKLTFIDLKKNRKSYTSAEKKEIRTANENKLVADFVLDEIGYYNTKAGIARFRICEAICNAGINGFCNLTFNSTEASDKDSIKIINEYSSAIRHANKVLSKHFPDGIKEFETTALASLYQQEEELELKLKEIRDALNSKDADTKALNEMSVKIRDEKKTLSKLIKESEKQNTLYHSAVAPFLSAQRTIKQKEFYDRINAELLV